MSNTILLARIGALIYLSIGLGVFINPGYFRKVADDLMKSPGMIYVASMMAVILGCLMVAVHNVWDWNWSVLITILGWAAILKGVAGLLFPEPLLNMSHRIINKIKPPAYLGGVAVILGLFLGYFGFFAV